MNESEFHSLADTTIAQLLDALEEADQAGALEVEHAAGVITVSLAGGKQLVVSKHAPSRQLWLSSPLQGGLHFAYRDKQWVLPDGRRLPAVLAQDLKTLAHLEVQF